MSITSACFLRSSLLAAALTTCACSSINSIEEASGPEADGLKYYMPRKSFVATVTMKGKKATAVELSTSAAQPDFGKQYVLRYAGNAFGKNALDVGVSEAGLLSTAKSTTESSVAEAFKGVAQVAGYLAAVRTVKVDSKAAAPTQCAADGTYVFIFDTPVQGAIVCDITVNITAIGTPPTTGHSRETGQAQSGVFYRQNLPYLMTADGSDVHTAAFVYSPTESPTYFLPISRTFFSNNSAEFGFAEGMPKTYKQETQGEIVALLKIPADVVAAYCRDGIAVRRVQVAGFQGSRGPGGVGETRACQAEVRRMHRGYQGQ